jgi:hypothetical protein
MRVPVEFRKTAHNLSPKSADVKSVSVAAQERILFSLKVVEAPEIVSASLFAGTVVGFSVAISCNYYTMLNAFNTHIICGYVLFHQKSIPCYFIVQIRPIGLMTNGEEITVLKRKINIEFEVSATIFIGV